MPTHPWHATHSFNATHTACTLTCPAVTHTTPSPQVFPHTMPRPQHYKKGTGSKAIMPDLAAMAWSALRVRLGAGGTVCVWGGAALQEGDGE